MKLSSCSGVNAGRPAIPAPAANLARAGRAENATKTALPACNSERRDNAGLIWFIAAPYAAPVTRATARMIDMCVPQRHFTPDSAALISANDARGFSRTNSAAVIIQPFMQ